MIVNVPTDYSHLIFFRLLFVQLESFRVLVPFTFVEKFSDTPFAIYVFFNVILFRIFVIRVKNRKKI